VEQKGRQGSISPSQNVTFKACTGNATIEGMKYLQQNWKCVLQFVTKDVYYRPQIIKI